MSFDAIRNYYREVEKLIHAGGTYNEKSIRGCFQILLNTYAKSKELILVPEVAIRGRKGRDVYPDGTLKDILRQDWGYWESKDEADDLEVEIQKKFDKGYPNDNILFEDSINAVLFQNGNEVCRIKVKDEIALDHILKSFIGFQRPEVAEFRKAIELFKRDVPKVTEALRNLIIDVAENVGYAPSLDQTQDILGQPKAVILHEATPSVEQVAVPAQTQASKVGYAPSLDQTRDRVGQPRAVILQNKYIAKRDAFLLLCREVINPNITKDDIREMVIQHILTADIFNTIFDEPNFHRENNIARELQSLVETFFTKEIRENTLAGIKHYYDTINARAAQIADHHEKQMFLKVVYETFYKSYDPKKADRLGVVYTPGEIVRFMIDSTDYLLGKHFGKQLEDKNVEILDPATGTGTFICDIIDHIRLDKLPYKYKNELHANEVEILPYYIANLNIEFTYKQKTGQYSEFENLCFVDTLDNMGFDYKDKQDDIFSLSDENADRIKRQNEKKISVIIGNPPYNANQMNSNDNNKNREYPVIDKRIKDTYIKQSKAQMTKLYDMYARFYRWAMDRLDENGIIAMITNRSFIDSRTFDGFRNIIQKEFDYAYIIDTKSDVRQNPKIAGTTHNVFGIQTGVAIMFLIKKKDVESSYCKIEYIAMQDEWKKEDKLQWLGEHNLKDIPFEHIQPDKDNNWINLSDNDWDSLIAVADKEVKGNKNQKAIFSLYSLGLCSHRDDWNIDFSKETLVNKTKYFCDTYNSERARWQKSDKRIKINDFVDRTIKWTDDLENQVKRNSALSFNENKIRESQYRPFVKQNIYYDRIVIDRVYQLDNMLPINNSELPNKVFCFLTGDRLPFVAYATKYVPNLAMFSLDPAQWVSLYRYDSDGNCHDNITDWAWGEFKAHYKDESITKEDIFHYVYGVLHNPAYRVKYEQNLKRSLPRIPYYEDFRKWAGWGKTLLDLHLNYETVEPYPLKREDWEDDYDILALPTDVLDYFAAHPEKSIDKDMKEVFGLLAEKHAKPKLKADKENGKIIIDNVTVLIDIPPEAWQYKLGNRSALEWILDQYKEKKPKDPTIARLFNTYKFADYKEQVIDLLMRVTTVSVETMKIVRQMEN
jgi:predicted helicase